MSSIAHDRSRDGGHLSPITEEQVPPELRQRIKVAAAFAELIVRDLERLRSMNIELQAEFDRFRDTLGPWRTSLAHEHLSDAADEVSGMDEFWTALSRIHDAADAAWATDKSAAA